ncbi:SMI1/KNR4 family protein [Paenibacillus sp. YPG26]|uniref:SMI1/KNR4 family protein n=1 Tax=Paenibacillus sp. YPG26 TaxID=2878915 RepID=UPI00203CDE8A|nr:SMI1/KNR4 family protein [Paenibacillus sp. YPG26]USB34825.1 SMI1/KNR4 family protein [Paenibacillus sp. YPG26]
MGYLSSNYQEIDEVLEKMQAAVRRTREQDPAFYAKYPMQLYTVAEDEDLQRVAAQWTLPDEYLYFLKHFVPQAVSWNTDDYINLDIYGAIDLTQGQSGYSFNPVKEEFITDWPTDYLVIASDEGDPYCLDLSRGDTAIYTAPHGAGTWDFQIAYDNLAEFLNSVLLPRSMEDEESENDVGGTYDYYKVFICGPGADRVKTLVFIKKTFSCDYTQAKTYLEEVPLLVFKGIESSAAHIEDQLKSIGADYTKQQISVDEFLQR